MVLIPVYAVLGPHVNLDFSFPVCFRSIPYLLVCLAKISLANQNLFLQLYSSFYLSPNTTTSKMKTISTLIIISVLIMVYLYFADCFSDVSVALSAFAVCVTRVSLCGISCVFRAILHTVCVLLLIFPLFPCSLFRFKYAI